jgi:hypothetical protein
MLYASIVRTSILLVTVRHAAFGNAAVRYINVIAARFMPVHVIASIFQVPRHDGSIFTMKFKKIKYSVGPLKTDIKSGELIGS